MKQISVNSPNLLDQLRFKLRAGPYSYRTEQAYVRLRGWGEPVCGILERSCQESSGCPQIRLTWYASICGQFAGRNHLRKASPARQIVHSQLADTPCAEAIRQTHVQIPASRDPDDAQLDTPPFKLKL